MSYQNQSPDAGIRQRPFPSLNILSFNNLIYIRRMRMPFPSQSRIVIVFILYPANRPIKILMAECLIRIPTNVVGLSFSSASAHPAAVRDVVTAGSTEPKASARHVTRSAQTATGQFSTPIVQVAVALESRESLLFSPQETTWSGTTISDTLAVTC